MNDDPTVVVLSNDLFFAMRIRSALSSMQYRTLVAKSVEEFEQTTSKGTFVLALVDFNHSLDWDKVRTVLATASFPTIAFGPHKDTDGFAAARAAGANRVVANSVFTTHLAELVEKYAPRQV